MMLIRGTPYTGFCLARIHSAGVIATTSQWNTCAEFVISHSSVLLHRRSQMNCRAPPSQTRFQLELSPTEAGVLGLLDHSQIMLIRSILSCAEGSSNERLAWLKSCLAWRSIKLTCLAQFGRTSRKRHFILRRVVSHRRRMPENMPSALQVVVNGNLFFGSCIRPCSLEVWLYNTMAPGVRTSRINYNK